MQLTIAEDYRVMIRMQSAAAPHAGATVWLSPNRSLSLRDVRTWSWVLGVLVVAVSLISVRDGNVFAPAFGLLESIALASALKLAWNATRRSECITVDERTLQVEDLPRHARVEFIAYWVRVDWKPRPGRRALVLTSHGREREVGEFLAEEEREELSRKLKALLADVTAPRHVRDQSTQG